MQFDEFSQRISRLLASLDELLIRWEILMHRPGALTIDHLAAGPLKPIAQLDIFHSVNEEVFVKPTNSQERRARRRYVSGVIVGKVHGTGSDRVGVVDPPMMQVSEERIVLFVPGRYDIANDRGVWIPRVIFQMLLDEIRLGQNVVIDKQNDFG